MVCATSKASDLPAHTRSLIRAFASHWNILSVKLLTERHLMFLSSKGGCTGWYESTPVKMSHCWKSHVTAQLFHAHVHLSEPTCTVKVSCSFKVKVIGGRQRSHVQNLCPHYIGPILKIFHTCPLHSKVKVIMGGQRSHNQNWFPHQISCTTGHFTHVHKKKYVHEVLVNRLFKLNAQEKSVVR